MTTAGLCETSGDWLYDIGLPGKSGIGGGIVTVSPDIVMYSLMVAGFVMLGAKLNQRFGALPVFRAAVVIFGVAQVLMTFSPNATTMLLAQGLCGAAGATIVPSLVALIVENYRSCEVTTVAGPSPPFLVPAAYCVPGPSTICTNPFGRIHLANAART